MLKIVLLLFLVFLNCYNLNGKLPLISYKCRMSSKVLEGNSSTINMSGGNKDLAIGKDGIRIRNKDFKFKKNIQALLVKYRFNYGDCMAYGTYSFDQITKYPIKIEINPITKDSIEILNVKNKIIRYKINNKVATIIEADSLQYIAEKLDTTFNKYKGNEQRLIQSINYKTTIKFMATLNLKTMQYEKDGKMTFLNWKPKDIEPKFKRLR